ncbi:Phosphoinositide phospholipase C 4 [Euphorbia peplus]|nr:Phosphoinositide phospholipase C 4 [Euphorbia peplus]
MTTLVPEELNAFFIKYSENGFMTVDHLRRFLIEIQKQDNVTTEEVQSIYDHFHDQKGLNLAGFIKYIFSDINPPIDLKRGVHQDMSAPLSHYFIWTGHNSYLTGNQLSSDCSDVPIIEALQKGVRVIELDIWPNSDKTDVEVLHGRTLTTPVDLIKCLRSIKEHAFTASDYPVVITLEDHLTPDLQAKVAEMVTQTFGDILFCPGSERFKDFPSPESLKKRVMISTKPPKEYLEDKDVKDGGGDGKACEGVVQADPMNELDDSSDDEEDIDAGNIKSRRIRAPEYKLLIAIHAGKPKGGLDMCLKVDPQKVRRLSLSEAQLEDAAETYGKEIVRFTQRNILRVYPKGTRVDSSNYNPLVGWMHGAQMVAFNMQGHGKSLRLMEGMFKANGGCGYVKKPSFLLESGSQGEVFDPRAELPAKTTLKVKVYMGEGWRKDCDSFDVFSSPDFYVRVRIAGVPADEAAKKTETVTNSWTPVWNEEFEFPLTVPELALLYVQVDEYDMSEKDDFGGQTCFPVWELRRGIRAIQLHNCEGAKYDSAKILMKFDFV